MIALSWVAGKKSRTKKMKMPTHMKVNDRFIVQKVCGVNVIYILTSFPTLFFNLKKVNRP